MTNRRVVMCERCQVSVITPGFGDKRFEIELAPAILVPWDGVWTSVHGHLEHVCGDSAGAGEPAAPVLPRDTDAELLTWFERQSAAQRWALLRTSLATSFARYRATVEGEPADAVEDTAALYDGDEAAPSSD